VYWTFLTPKDITEGEEAKPIPFLKCYYVWNREQTEGLTEPEEIPSNIITPIEEGERIIQGYKDCPEIFFGGNRAYYHPALDSIHCPVRDAFTGSNEYYSTLFHEMVHSTGSEHRLNRNIKNSFGSEDYSKEELVAELGAAFLCGISGIDNTSTKENTAAYIQSWIKVLKNDVKFFFEASRLAGKAVQYITGNN
jgi:antirestriction protein ArdC